MAYASVCRRRREAGVKSGQTRRGGRVADRLKELCVPLVFKGKSKRVWTK